MNEKKLNNFLRDLLDYFLLVVENLLAFRVVFSYLGAKGTVVQKLSDYILFPFLPLINKTTLTSDMSSLELVPAALVIILFYLHRFLDKKAEPA